jgi:hypothetical protein
MDAVYLATIMTLLLVALFFFLTFNPDFFYRKTQT